MPSMLKSMKMRSLAVLLLLPALTQADVLNEAIDAQVETDKAAQASQQKIDSLADETTDMQAEYRHILNQTQSLQTYNDQLRQLVTSQTDEMDAIQQQLDNIDTTQRDIVPLMLKMVSVLESFVALDLPFLQQERADRIDALNSMMGRADVTLVEKYRRIMEAYQVEMEYGRTIESYQAQLTTESGERTVEFLRVGRVGLYYLTLDGLQAGAWDTTSKQWLPLADDQIQNVATGLKVARKELPPDLLVLPMKAEGAQP